MKKILFLLLILSSFQSIGQRTLLMEKMKMNGKIIEDIDTSADFSNASNKIIPSQKAVKDWVESLPFGAASLDWSADSNYVQNTIRFYNGQNYRKINNVDATGQIPSTSGNWVNISVDRPIGVNEAGAVSVTTNRDTTLTADTYRRNQSVSTKYASTIADNLQINELYSVFNLNNRYSGKAMVVVNDADQEKVIYYRAGIIDTDAIMSHAQSATDDIYVKEWYSSAGSSETVKLYQTDKALMPRIAIDSVLQTRNGQPALYFQNNANMLFREAKTYSTDTMSVLLVADFQSAFGRQMATGNLSSSAGAGLRTTSTQMQWSVNGGYTSGNNYIVNNSTAQGGGLHASLFVMNADTGSLYVDTAYIAPTTYNPGGFNGQNFHLGGYYPGSGPTPSFGGWVSEFIVFNDNVIDDRSDIFASVNGRYGIWAGTEDLNYAKGYVVTLPQISVDELGTTITISIPDIPRESYIQSSDSIYDRGSLLNEIKTKGAHSYSFQSIKDSKDSLRWKMISTTDMSRFDTDTISVRLVNNVAQIAALNIGLGKTIRLPSGAEYEVAATLHEGTTADGVAQIQTDNGLFARLLPVNQSVRQSWFDAVNTDRDSMHLNAQAALNYVASAPGMYRVIADYDTITYKNEIYIPERVHYQGLNSGGDPFALTDEIQQTTYVDFQGDTTKFLLRPAQDGDFYQFGVSASDFYVEAKSLSGGVVFNDSGWGNRWERIFGNGTDSLWFTDGFGVRGSLHGLAEQVYMRKCKRDFSGIVVPENGANGSNFTYIRCGAQGGHYGLYNVTRSEWYGLNMEDLDSTAIHMDNGAILKMIGFDGERNRKLIECDNCIAYLSDGKFTPETQAGIGYVDTGRLSFTNVSFGNFNLNPGMTSANTISFSMVNCRIGDQRIMQPEDYFFDMKRVRLDHITVENNDNGGQEKTFTYTALNQIENPFLKEPAIQNPVITGSGKLSIKLEQDTLNLVPHSAFVNEIGEWESTFNSGNVSIRDTVITDHLGDTTTAIVIEYINDLSASLQFITNYTLSANIEAGQEYNVSFYAYREGTGDATVFFNMANDDNTMKFAPIRATSPTRYHAHKTCDVTTAQLAWRISDDATAGDKIILYGIQVSIGEWPRRYQKMPSADSNNPFIEISSGSLEVRGDQKIIGDLEVTGNLIGSFFSGDVTAVTTSGAGVATIAHGLGVTPSSSVANLATNGDTYYIAGITFDATNIYVNIFERSSDTAAASAGINISWIVIK